MFKRGQVAIYIILALVIIVAGVLLYMFYPQINSVLRGQSSPNQAVRTCLEPTVQSYVTLLSGQGGYENPEGFATYKGNKVKYLCYQSQYYLPCKPQPPMPFIRLQFEQELARLLTEKAQACIEQVKEGYERDGYDVSSEPVKVKVDLVPHTMLISVNASMRLKRGDKTENVQSFFIDRRSEMYSLLMTAYSIVEYEVAYGNSEVTQYMAYYPNLKIEKDRLADDSKIYTVTDVTTDEKFRFASRSVAWPAGYGASV